MVDREEMAVSASVSGNQKRIRKLEEAVINRIAAGEVIQRPSNALKEMIENSLDAGATSIQVTVKGGGLKLLQILDNGCGIQKEDLSIVCERFTTSKLKTFEDLSSINTYGFRGEALASISHVSHVIITTRTANDKCAYKAAFSDGKMLAHRSGELAEPKPCAGNKGTQIHIEDLFYNMPSRRNALRSPSDEYHKVIDVVSKYAIHNAGVSFTLKKFGESIVDVKTSLMSTISENIGTIYGQSIARELLDVKCNNSKLGYDMQGLTTNANYSVKKFEFLLFINNRLVDCSSLRKAIETVYSAYLPKHSHPFVYMKIDIMPCNVDVNVHPTKHEVHFLHEDLIVEEIRKCFEDTLLGCNESRTYYTQALLPGACVSSFSLEESCTQNDNKDRTYAHDMIRTDAKEQTLDSFIIPPAIKDLSKDTTLATSSSISNKDIVVSSSHKRKTSSGSILCNVAKKRKHHTVVQLTSVKTLLKAIKDKEHHELMALFNGHKFVGCVDQTKSLIQYQTKLYLINLTKISQDFFYQLVLLDFSNFKSLQLVPPPSLYKLALIALDSPESGWTSEDGPKESLAEFLVDFLKGKSEMLEDYFSLKIDQNSCLVSLPIVLESLTPNMDRLPMFILRLGTEVNWENEMECFDGLAKELALFYCLQHDPFMIDSGENVEDKSSMLKCDKVLIKATPWKWIVEHVLFPALRTDFIPSQSLSSDGSILQIADLKELYKVFERC